MPLPPPIRPASETVWCGARKGRSVSRPAPGGKHSGDAVDLRGLERFGKVSRGRMPASRLASIVLPEPGGPIISTLCVPAAATSSARLAVVWPRTSRKSGTDGIRGGDSAS